ncbi:MAG TPA: hypothetical protein VI033_03230, partial [Candidatus Nitrosopolaris sp.]
DSGFNHSSRQRSNIILLIAIVVALPISICNLLISYWLLSLNLRRVFSTMLLTSDGLSENSSVHQIIVTGHLIKIEAINDIIYI